MDATVDVILALGDVSYVCGLCFLKASKIFQGDNLKLTMQISMFLNNKIKCSFSIKCEYCHGLQAKFWIEKEVKKLNRTQSLI